MPSDIYAQKFVDTLSTTPSYLQSLLSHQERVLFRVDSNLDNGCVRLDPWKE